jgi:multiple sugar transport system substrate-binding protein
MKSKWRISLTAAVAVVGLLAPVTVSAANAAPVEIPLWTHNGGNAAELADVNLVVKDFNASQKKYKVVVKAFPQINYNDAIVASAAANRLPCIMDTDAPVVPSWVYAGYLSPLTVDKKITDKLQASVKGSYGGKLYSAGFYDAAIALLARKSTIKEAGLRTPTTAKPWTLAEFNEALAKAKASGKYDYALSLGTGWDGEWYPYGFSPLLQSFGGDLINRKTLKTAEGSLNGAAGLAWGKWFQNLFTSGLAPKKETADQRDNGFIAGKLAYQWNGSWAAANAAKALGDDFIALPPPNLGTKAYIGGGSWQWAVSSTCANKAGANAWLTYALQTKYLVKFADDLFNLPITPEATKASKIFGPGSKYSDFATYSATFALIRPATPAYPVIAKIYETATKDIINGADVQKTLDTAVDQIDKNLKDNYYYVKKK